MNSDPIRVEVLLTEHMVKDIHKLMSQSGIASRKEFFEYALLTLRWALMCAKKGRTICALDVETGKYRELSIPPLDGIKNSEGVCE